MTRFCFVLFFIKLGENYTIQVAVLNQPDANFSISKIVLTNSKGIKERLRVTIVSSEDTTFVYAKKMFNLEVTHSLVLCFNYQMHHTFNKDICNRRQARDVVGLF